MSGEETQNKTKNPNQIKTNPKPKKPHLMRNLQLRRTNSQTERPSLPLPKNHKASRCLNQWKTDEKTDFLNFDMPFSKDYLQNVCQGRKLSLASSSKFLFMKKFRTQYL